MFVFMQSLSKHSKKVRRNSTFKVISHRQPLLDPHVPLGPVHYRRDGLMVGAVVCNLWATAEIRMGHGLVSNMRQNGGFKNVKLSNKKGLFFYGPKCKHLNFKTISR